VIPCILTIQSTDAQALDLLSSPNSPVIQLRRVVKVQGSSKPTNSSGTRLDDVQIVESASWRPTIDVEGLPSTTRRLDGEIQLAKDLKPSFSVASLAVEVRAIGVIVLPHPYLYMQYSVVVHPFEAAAFVPDEKVEILTEAVEIATVLPCGPRPLSFSPPNYKRRRSQVVQNPANFMMFSPGPFIMI
jgi:hypothetical protein